jgi:general stress protein 26
MDKRQLMNRVEEILEDAKAAVLTTVDEEGRPQVRWMTPTVLKGREGFLYTVTTPKTRKLVNLEGQPVVEWMIQTRALTEVVNLRGIMREVDNPALKAEVLEEVGARLTVFWKINPEKTDFVITETMIGEASYFKPMKAEKIIVQF